jgi:hypothetical protein
MCAGQIPTSDVKEEPQIVTMNPEGGKPESGRENTL